MLLLSGLLPDEWSHFPKVGKAATTRDGLGVAALNQPTKLPLTVVFLARDEESNLGRSLPVAVDRAADVVVVDSFSTDSTFEFAQRLGARVFRNRYEYHAQQVNWAIEHLGVDAGPWVLLLNADEVPDDELWEEIGRVVTSEDAPCDGYYLNFKVYFMGRWIRHGGYYPLLVLRLFRRQRARCENRRMDEKIIVDGPIGRLRGHVIDDNRKGLSYFVLKHDAYASREAEDFVRRREGEPGYSIDPDSLGDFAKRKRRAKQIYDRLPLLLRARLYFWYRMYVRLGFLDGREGRAYHYLQGYWYRLLVDLKILERQKREARTDDSRRES